MGSSEVLMKAFRNKTKQIIFTYLLIYNELTLDQLSELLQKSKSTIHHHMQHLLEAGLVFEETKRGSKTIYYKLQIIRQDTFSQELYDRDRVEELDSKAQHRKLIEYSEYITTLMNVQQNLIELNQDRVDHILEEVDKESITPFEGFSSLDDQYMALYFGSLENAKSFKEELRQLVMKYYDMESESKNKVRPYSYVIFGVNSKDVLDKKFSFE